jgi:hypothetical protein
MSEPCNKKIEDIFVRASAILRLCLLIAPWAIIITLSFSSAHFNRIWSIIDDSLIIQSLIGSFSGAVGAAALFYYLDHINKKRQLLASINTSLALMAGHISTLINYKSQHLIPLKEEKDRIIKYMETVVEIRKINPGKEIEVPPVEATLLLQKVPAMPDEFLLNLESLAEFAERFPMAIIYIVKSKEALTEFKSFLQDWRNLVDEVRTSKYDPEGAKLPFIMGKMPINGNIDTRVPDTIENLLHEADKALFFLRRASEELQSRGEKVLPRKISKQLAKSVTKDGYEKYMPPRDLYPTWQD